MPILKIDTNLSDEKVPETFNENATKMIAKALSKPHQNITVMVNTNKRLTLGGSSEPAALIELRSIGGLKGPNAAVVVEKLTKFIQSELNLPIEKFYINFFDMDPECVAHNGELRSVTLARPNNC